MSARGWARKRQAVTGEKYQLALAHERRACGRCQKGLSCAGCALWPCFLCRNRCTTGRTCVFDNLQPDGSVVCAACGQPPRKPPGE